MPYAVIDIESSGLDPWRNEIIQIGCVVLDKDLNERGTYETGLRPENIYQYSKEAEAVHGISLETALSFKPRSRGIREFVDFLYGHSPVGDFSFVCHALPRSSDLDLIDRNFMFSTFWIEDLREDYYRLFPDRRVLSTISRRRNDHFKNYGFKSQKLAEWGRVLGMEMTGHHDALFDARMCAEVLKYKLKNQGGIL